MEESTKKRGTVTSIGSMFPAEEAQKAAKRVNENIVEKQKELDTLKGFISDNSSLINLVQRLPEELHHDIMVPFGKAAFFPGRLIHTNEFLVLLGEGYYAERTAKQTAEILKRRGTALEYQVDSLRANMEDLRAEASFFDATASEAAEGLVEIREDYEENYLEGTSESAKQESSTNTEMTSKKIALEDDEYVRLMSKLDELEKEELEAESNSECNEQELIKAAYNQIPDQNSGLMEEHQSSKELHGLSNEFAATLEVSDENHEQKFTDQFNFEDLTRKSPAEDHGRRTASLGKASMAPEAQQNTQVVSPRNEAFACTIVEDPQTAQSYPSIQSNSEVPMKASKPQIDSGKVSERAPKPRFDSSKAFTGSIVERTENLITNPKEEDASESSRSRASKPVSRFKALRR